MRGSINENGNLCLHGRVNQNVVCPYVTPKTEELFWYCGDWCPQFGDPTKTGPGNGTSLDICQGRRLYFEAGNFTDEREVAK